MGKGNWSVKKQIIKTFTDDDSFLKPYEYFETELNSEKIKVYPEHVQYDAQYMR